MSSIKVNMTNKLAQGDLGHIYLARSHCSSNIIIQAARREQYCSPAYAYTFPFLSILSPPGNPKSSCGKPSASSGLTVSPNLSFVSLTAFFNGLARKLLPRNLIQIRAPRRRFKKVLKFVSIAYPFLHHGMQPHNDNDKRESHGGEVRDGQPERVIPLRRARAGSPRRGAR